jgi:RNA-binding protein
VTDALTSAQRRKLRAQAHRMHPIVQVGRQGMSEAFLAEVDRALTTHELIKIRLRGERAEREEQLQAIADALGCASVSAVGGVAVLYRKSEEPAPGAAEPTQDEEESP